MFIASGGMKKHAAIAAAIVLVVGAGLWVWAQRDSQSADAPIPGTWDGAARQVDIPGVDFALDKEVVLIDATHAWAYVYECPHSYPQREPCRSALGVSADGGKTWRRVSMPGKTGEMEYDHGTEPGPRWLPLNDTTVSLVTLGEIYVTRDQGKVWASYPLDNPPVETQRAANLADNFGSRNGDYAFLCPGISIVEPANEECGPVLTLLGTGPVAPQPKLSGRLAAVQQGGDGRIWLTRVTGENEMRIAVSGDGGKSGQDLPPTTLGGLELSPDGSKAIITHHIQQWRLDGQQWVQFPGKFGGSQMTDAVVRNDGQIAGVLQGKLEGKGVYLSAGNQVTQIAGMPTVEAVSQLPDGTVVFQTWSHSNIMYAGTSQGWYTLNVRSAE